ncbi:MAG TPA: hypothetical protein PKV21_01085 [bacterium]|nr:hypothetical protein [bacterium]HOM26082.1 hypothetical protein [bacterium]
MFFSNLFFLILNSFLLAGIFGVSGIIEFFVIFLIFFYFQIYGISIILGLFKILYPQFILIFLFLIFLFLLPEIKKIKLPDLKNIPFKISIFLCLTVSLHLLYIFNLLILPPLTTDGLLYHLPFAVHYYKTHSISLPNLYFTEISMTYYPIGGEIFYFFSILSKKEFLFKFTQFPFLILGCFSVFLISKSFGLSDFLSTLSAISFSLIKPVFKESTMCFVDLMMASTFITTYYFFNKKEKKYIFPGLLSLSLLLSIKTLSLLFALLLLPFLFQKKSGKFSKLLYFSVFYLLFFGLFSYWRNLLLTGNPVYPADITLGNFTLFRGAYIYQKVSIIEKIKNLFSVLAFSSLHIDPSFNLKIVLLLFFLISFTLSIRKREILIFYFLFPLSILLYFLLIPSTYFQIRHLLPVYGILSISLFYPFQKLEYLCIAVFLYFFLSVFPSSCISLFLIIFSILFISFFIINRIKKPVFYVPLLLLFILFLIFQVDIKTPLYKEIKFEFWKSFYKEEGEIWEFVQKNSKEGKNIAYVGSFFIYPFYGENFQNNVFYQSVNSIKTIPVYKYRKRIKYEEPSENLYRENPDFKKWIEGLKNEKTDWIIIKKDKEYIERKWIEENPDIFKILYSTNYAEIYKLKIE